MTTRWWIIVVAVVAVGCAAVASVVERRERFARIAEPHGSVFMTPTTICPDPERQSAERLTGTSRCGTNTGVPPATPGSPLGPTRPSQDRKASFTIETFQERAMRLSYVRFTIGAMMIAVAGAGVGLAVPIQLQRRHDRFLALAKYHEASASITWACSRTSQERLV
jgi:hypothetical protein